MNLWLKLLVMFNGSFAVYWIVVSVKFLINDFSITNLAAMPIILFVPFVSIGSIVNIIRLTRKDKHGLKVPVYSN